jgi:hypothetical protein
MFWLICFRLKITSTSQGGSKSEDLLQFSGNSFKRLMCFKASCISSTTLQFNNSTFCRTAWWGGGNQVVYQDILDQMQLALEHEDTKLVRIPLD